MSNKGNRKSSNPSDQLSNPAAEELRQHLVKEFPERKRRGKYTGPWRPFQIGDRTENNDPWNWEASVGVLDTNTSPCLSFSFTVFLLTRSCSCSPTNEGGK